MFNFEVEECHNYFVGQSGVLVHNDCEAGKPAQEVLQGTLRRKFPGEHLNKSLNQIKNLLKTAFPNEPVPPVISNISFFFINRPPDILF